MFTFIQSIFAYFGFEKSPLLTIEDKYTDPPNIENDDDLDDDAWVAKKREFWKKNNIQPLKIKGGSMKPKELEKLLVNTFPPLKSDIEM